MNDKTLPPTSEEHGHVNTGPKHRNTYVKSVENTPNIDLVELLDALASPHSSSEERIDILTKIECRFVRAVLGESSDAAGLSASGCSYEGRKKTIQQEWWHSQEQIGCNLAVNLIAHLSRLNLHLGLLHELAFDNNSVIQALTSCTNAESASSQANDHIQNKRPSCSESIVSTNKKIVEKLEINSLAEEAIACLSMLQGLCLAHGPSRQICARRSSIELLLVLTEAQYWWSWPSRFQTALFTPIHAIDALMCTLVNKEATSQVFEMAGGLQVVMRIFANCSQRTSVHDGDAENKENPPEKGNSNTSSLASCLSQPSVVTEAQKMLADKCLEFLVFYLRPEDLEDIVRNDELPDKSKAKPCQNDSEACVQEDDTRKASSSLYSSLTGPQRDFSGISSFHTAASTSAGHNTMNGQHNTKEKPQQSMKYKPDGICSYDTAGRAINLRSDQHVNAFERPMHISCPANPTIDNTHNTFTTSERMPLSERHLASQRSENISGDEQKRLFEAETHHSPNKVYSSTFRSRPSHRSGAYASEKWMARQREDNNIKGTNLSRYRLAKSDPPKERKEVNNKHTVSHIGQTDTRTLTAATQTQPNYSTLIAEQSRGLSETEQTSGGHDAAESNELASERTHTVGPPLILPRKKSASGTRDDSPNSPKRSPGKRSGSPSAFPRITGNQNHSPQSRGRTFEVRSDLTRSNLLGGVHPPAMDSFREKLAASARLPIGDSSAPVQPYGLGASIQSAFPASKSNGSSHGGAPMPPSPAIRRAHARSLSPQKRKGLAIAIEAASPTRENVVYDTSPQS